ncbi:leucine-rich repeat domain-containing protein [Treponema parvum]|uniref:Leucine-rich repeat domain-containing protein n=1 Tax=Treponema parvum TaxID=138851 RepID=A0A975EZ99_9SPIR|nr:leucine-rich repeat domain-containing protein [Treponema parvum]QTQ11522.1 leucine-rich repeat domain-containing protein [Treponema parvum]
MKQSNVKANVCAFGGAAALITAALLTAALLFTGCSNAAGGSDSGGSGGGGTPPAPPGPFAVTFSVDGTPANGTLKAKVGGSEINSGDKVEKGKTVIFTATPAPNYKVKEWKVDGTVVTGNTTDTYTHPVTKEHDVKVSFEALPAGYASYTVKHYQEKAEGGYPEEPTETETLSGKVGESAAYTQKTYEGFTYKSSLTEVNGNVQLSGTIESDGSTVIKLFYERKTVHVTFNLAGGNVGGNAGPIVKTGKYGATFTAPADPVKTDAVFKGWNPVLPSPLLFPVADAEYTAQWTPRYTITFGVDGTPANGTLNATVDGNEIHSGAKVEEDKTVTFTATPESGYKVKEWKVGGAVVTGSTSNTYTHPVTEAVAVTVSFEVGSAVLTLSSGTTTVKVTAKTFDNSAITVEGCNEASLASSYTETTLHPKGTTVVLKGKIIDLTCKKNNQLTALDVQDLSALQSLACYGNQLIALNVQGLSALQWLNCYDNKLTALNVQGLSNLKELSCDKNKLTSLNVQGLSNLEELNCSKNQLTSLNVQGLSKLQKLNCYGNKLTALNVQGLSALQKLNCEANQLTALNVQGLSALKELHCNINQLESLNVQGLSNLKELSCAFNKLKSLNVQGLSALQQLYCGPNKLTTLNVQGLSALQTLNCSGNELPALNVQGLSNLKELSCAINKLNAQALTQVLTDLLPRTPEDKAKCTLYFEGPPLQDYEGNQIPEGNYTDFTSPSALKTAFDSAKTRNWKMYKYINENGKPKEVELN